MSVTADYANGIGGVRQDETSVRLVFVEHSADYAALVCETLERARKGHFEVRHASRMDAALRDVEEGECDAVLVDWTTHAADAVTIDAASSIATRVPVIVLTGNDDETAPEGGDSEAAFRDRMADSGLPSAILSAVRRHRRLGQSGASELIVWRDPLRAFARAFARVRHSLAG